MGATELRAAVFCSDCGEKLEVTIDVDGASQPRGMHGIKLKVAPCAGCIRKRTQPAEALMAAIKTVVDGTTS